MKNRCIWGVLLRDAYLMQTVADFPEYTFENVTDLLARVSELVVGDDLVPTVPAFAAPVRLRWAGLDIQIPCGELRLEGPRLLVRIGSQSPDEPIPHDAFLGVLNQAATLDLADGSIVWCPFAHPRRFGMNGDFPGFPFTFDLSLAVWEWLPTDFSGGVLLGFSKTRPPYAASNLLVEAKSRGRFGFRGLGQFNWHVIDLRESGAYLAEGSIERGCSTRLRGDLMAMEYTFGESIPLDVLWLADATGTTRGGVGLARSSAGTYRTRCPTPNRVNEHRSWSAPLFRAVAAELGNDDSDIATAICGYMDALRVHIHGGYLLAQVALEAFCAVRVPKEDLRPLVVDTAAWKDWVDSHESVLKAHCKDEVSKKIFLNKLRDNVIERPKSESVAKAFGSWALTLPPVLKKEIGRRNRSAHKFVMFDEADGNIQEASDRVEMVQTMLAAAIAVAVGYKGRVAGWERDRSGYQKPVEDWFGDEAPDLLRQYRVGVRKKED